MIRGNSLEFRDVWLRDPKDPQQWILKDINFKSTPGNPIYLVCSEKATLRYIIDLATNMRNADAGGVFIGEEISVGGVSCLDANLDGFNMNLTIDQYLSLGLSEVPSKEQIRTAILIAGIEAKNGDLANDEAQTTDAQSLINAIGSSDEVARILKGADRKKLVGQLQRVSRYEHVNKDQQLKLGSLTQFERVKLALARSMVCQIPAVTLDLN